MIDRQVKRYSSKRPRPARVAVNYSLCVQLSTISIRCAQNYNEVILSILLNNLLDSFLTFQVKCSGCRSNKTLSLCQYRLSASAFYTFFNSWALHTIPLTNYYYSLSLQLHL